jgi:hypothetical protein
VRTAPPVNTPPQSTTGSNTGTNIGANPVSTPAFVTVSRSAGSRLGGGATTGATEVAFMDPMTARKLDTSLLPEDHIVELSTSQRLALTTKRWLVDLPTAIKNGLTGNTRYTMSDFAVLQQLPYYLGGVGLTLGYLAGKDRISTWQQGLGVLGYYVTFSAAQKLVNTLYKARYGVDFDLMYETPTHRMEKVYGSVSYPRIDLLRPKDYWAMRQKMAIPDEVASPNEAVKHQLPNILSAAWLDRMVLSNVLAAVVTGYVTRLASVKGLPAAVKSLGVALRSPKSALALASLATLRALWPKAAATPAKRLAMGLSVGAPVAVFAHAMHAQSDERYESSGLPDPPQSRLQHQLKPFTAFSLKASNGKGGQS